MKQKLSEQLLELHRSYWDATTKNGAPQPHDHRLNRLFKLITELAENVEKLEGELVLTPDQVVLLRPKRTYFDRMGLEVIASTLPAETVERMEEEQ